MPTIAVILVASSSQLEAEILEAGPEFKAMQGLPKALLPVTGGMRVLDYWWGAIEKLRAINDVYLVTNAKHFKHFERWATARGIPASHVVNDGSTTASTTLGAARDLALGLRRAEWYSTEKQPDVMVIAGDSLFHREFDLHTVLLESHAATSSVVVSYRLSREEDPSTRGMIEIDATRRVTRFVEKPGGLGRNRQSHTDSNIACPLFYVLKPAAANALPDFVAKAAAGDVFAETTPIPKPSLGDFMEWVVHDRQLPVYSLKLPGIFRLIGNAGLREYLDLVEQFERVDDPTWAGAVGRGTLTVKARARVGLFGNPSDGYHGKTIALTIANFWASATIAPSDRLTLVPHPLFDPCDFGSLADLHFVSRREGYQGGMRLLQAACKRFHEYCVDKGVALPRRNFTLSYDTNVPRQVGLAGSSAIVTAAVKALMAFYDLDKSHIPDPQLPSLVLEVESELGIVAGLQDRVVQAYEGLVYMDFDRHHFERDGHGHYERLPPSCLRKTMPLLFLAYCGEPSDSGRIHSDVKARYLAGDPDVIASMDRVADVALRAKKALFDADKDALRQLMAENFALRRQLFGDDVLGNANLQLVDIADRHGGVAKLPGSGGAVVGVADDDEHLDRIRAAYENAGAFSARIILGCSGFASVRAGFVFTVIEPYFGADHDDGTAPTDHHHVDFDLPAVLANVSELSATPRQDFSFHAQPSRAFSERSITFGAPQHDPTA